MYIHIFRWEIYAEKVPPTKMLIDWDFSPGENHIWACGLHIVFNRLIRGNYGEKTNGASDSRSGGT